jgi:ABC-type amino acid transport substrate-binding protein
MTAPSAPDISKTLLTGLLALLFTFTSLIHAQPPQSPSTADSNIPERVIRVGFLEHSEPLALKKDNYHSGILIDMFADTLAPPGVRFEVKVMPYARIIAELMAGHLDMTFVGRIPNRVKLPPTDQLVITQPLIVSPLYLYSRADKKITITKPTDLGNYHFGGVRLREILDPPPTPGNPKISYFKSPGHLYKSLAAGRIDVALAGPVVTNYWQTQLNTKFKMATPFGKMYSHFAFSVKSLREDVYPICQQIVQNWSTPKAKSAFNESAKRYQSQLLTEFVRDPPTDTPIEELCFTVGKYLEYEKQNPQIMQINKAIKKRN